MFLFVFITELDSSYSYYNEIKACIEKIGSNRILRDKKIEFDLVLPYQEIAKYKVLESNSPALAGLLKSEIDKTLLCWWIRRDSNSRPNKELISFLQSLETI
jgi:hypothetical protein